MRINSERQSIDMEERDWNYIMPAYIRSYLFHMKNSQPLEIVFPTFKSVSYGGMTIPVRYIDPDNPEATEIKVNGSDIAEATEAEITRKDTEEKPSVIAQLEEATKEIPAARAAFASDEPTGEEEETALATPPGLPESKEEPSATEHELPDTAIPEATQQPPQSNLGVPGREPKQPAHPIPPGQSLDDMTPRDKADQKRVAKDLLPEPDIRDDKEDSKGHKGKEGSVEDIEVKE